MFNHRNKTLFKDKKKIFKPGSNGSISGEGGINLSFLDYMSVEDFMSAVKSHGAELSSAGMLKLIFAISTQLKGLRALLSLHSFLTSSETNCNMLDRVMDTAFFILNVENIFLLQFNPTENCYVITHSNQDSVIGLKVSSVTNKSG